MDSPGSTQARGTDAEALTRTRYLRAVLAADVVAARQAVETALREGMTPERLYLGVFAHALYDVGELWQQGRATIAQEHLATATTQALMARLWPETAPTPDRAPCAITTATEGDWHVLGSRFVADFLQAEGWTVLDLGANTPAPALRQLVADTRPALVCLSTALSGNLPAAAATVAALRSLENPPLVAVGGHAYRGRADLARELGADLHATDAAAFRHALRARLAEPALP